MSDPVPSGSPTDILMVGIGGYGHFYLKTLLEEFPVGSVTIAGVVEPYPERCEMTAVLNREGIPLFSTIEEFFSARYRADLAVIASPIHRHVPQSIIALEKGCHVLLDKPLGATVQEADDLIRARDRSKGRVMVGYQWSYSAAIQYLKRDIMQGRFGDLLRLKTLCLWPRDLSYYRRNDWAGRMRDRDGAWILDSPANNAMAHFLHNLLYLAGERVDRSLELAEVEAELYRAYPIENCDTTVLRAVTGEGVELFFYASHAVKSAVGPIFDIEFSEASVSFEGPATHIVVTDRQGERVTYGSPESDHQFLKLFDAVRMVRGEGKLVCGPEAARSQTVCVNGMQESVPEIPDFPDELVRSEPVGDDDERRWVDRLVETLLGCYAAWRLPSEAGVSWASKGSKIDLKDYRGFTR